MEALARFDQMLKNMHSSEFLIAPLRHQEAVISSRMEGTISTMDEILQYEADYGDDVKETTEYRSEILETVLYQITLKKAQDAVKDGFGVSDFLIRSLHQGLLSAGRGANKSPGKYKDEQNYLVDKLKKKILFIPISPEKLREGLDDLFEYTKSSEQALIKTAISHVEFESLHPFKDGNGRIGRMLVTLMLWDSGIISEPHFHLSGYLEEHKDTYIELMKNVSKNHDWTDWCVFFLEAIEQQATRNLAITEDIKALYEDMKLTFSQKLSSKHSYKALDFIFTHPIFRSNRFTNKAGIPTSTAYTFINTLLKENLIQTMEEASGSRPALYSFEPLMELVRV